MGRGRKADSSPESAASPAGSPKASGSSTVSVSNSKRGSKGHCPVCGGPHGRSQCPGFEDGGSRMSRFRDPKSTSRKAGQARESRKQRGQKERKDSETPSHLCSPVAAPSYAPLVDSLCDLEAMLSYESSYALAHRDNVSRVYADRVAKRKSQGLPEVSWSRFSKVDGYPKFQAVISHFDVTKLDKSHWQDLLQEDGVYAVFGIPPLSAYEVTESDWEHLLACLRHPKAVGVGPAGFDMSKLPGGDVQVIESEQHVMSADEMLKLFGVGPSEKYEPAKDPRFLAVADATSLDAWVLKRGDQRLKAFNEACAQYWNAQYSSQVAVCERQLAIAIELQLTFVAHVSPHDAAERALCEVLKAKGPSASKLKLHLTGFRGRPVCAAALLQSDVWEAYVAFSGLLTHGKLRDRLAEIAFDTPVGRLMLESLAPLYPPSRAAIDGGRGSYSNPAHIVSVAEELAEIKRMSLEDVLAAACENAQSLYGIGPSHLDLPA